MYTENCMQMNPWPMILFMFSSSVLLGSFVTGMTPLSYDISHYTVSATRIGAAWYMASWMGMIEVVMSARMMKSWNANHTFWATAMLLNAGISLSMLRSQAFIDSNAWATRMIEHHSTAITTSRKLCQHCDRNETLCDLACQIVATQLSEIGSLQMHSNYNIVSIASSCVALALALPIAVISYRTM